MAAGVAGNHSLRGLGPDDIGTLVSLFEVRCQRPVGFTGILSYFGKYVNNSTYGFSCTLTTYHYCFLLQKPVAVGALRNRQIEKCPWMYLGALVFMLCRNDEFPRITKD